MSVSYHNSWDQYGFDMALIWLLRVLYGNYPGVFWGYSEKVLEIIEIGYWLGFIKVQHNY
jgi:hypothetical protein